MAHTMRILFGALLIAASANAQERPVVEIGTRVGVMVHSGAGKTLTEVGIPGLGVLGQPTIYASFFGGGKVLVEPQLALMFVNRGNYNSTTFGFAALVGYLFKGSAVSSPFAAAALGAQSISVSFYEGDRHSEGDFGVGGAVGYRFVIRRSVGLRVEGGYRRWFDSELNEFTFGIGIGAIVHGTQ